MSPLKDQTISPTTDRLTTNRQVHKQHLSLHSTKCVSMITDQPSPPLSSPQMRCIFLWLCYMFSQYIVYKVFHAAPVSPSWPRSVKTTWTDETVDRPMDRHRHRKMHENLWKSCSIERSRKGTCFQVEQTPRWVYNLVLIFRISEIYSHSRKFHRSLMCHIYSDGLIRSALLKRS